MILVNIICWVFVVYCLINGRKIEKEVNTGYKYAAVIVFLILGILFYVSSKSAIWSASIVLAGVVYSTIPTGYNNNAIYIKGNEYTYKKMTDAKILEEGNCYRLTFVYKGRPYFISVKKEERYILEDVIARYRRSQVL